MPHSVQPYGLLTHQAPLSMGFSRQEYWNKWVSMPSSRGSSQPRIEPVSLMSYALKSGFFTTRATLEAPEKQGG